MEITYRIDKDILYIAVEGRIDASNAAVEEESILHIRNENPGRTATTPYAPPTIAPTSNRFQRRGKADNRAVTYNANASDRQLRIMTRSR